MSIQIIGAGLGRTGTLSLKAALEELGFTKCYHMVEVFTVKTMRRPDSAVWRAGRLGHVVRWVPGDGRFAELFVYREQMEKYPEARLFSSARPRSLV